jgi:hypothetical protein
MSIDGRGHPSSRAARRRAATNRRSSESMTSTSRMVVTVCANAPLHTSPLREAPTVVGCAVAGGTARPHPLAG